MNGLELENLSYEEIENGIGHFIACLRETLRRMEENAHMERSKLTILKNVGAVLNERRSHPAHHLAFAIFEMIDPSEKFPR